MNEFDAGALWPGVWTRDVSYSILLSLALLDPKRAEATLLRKVNRDRIIQDTGTGGSWPVSTDRVCWSVAAWEIYLVTGDKQWLRRAPRLSRTQFTMTKQPQDLSMNGKVNKGMVVSVVLAPLSINPPAAVPTY